MNDAQPPALRLLGRYLREPINGLSHLLGVLLSIAGLIALLVLSDGEPWRTASFAVYGSSLVLLFTASTLLHSLKVSRRGQQILTLFDHAAIFILIAGSYTPIALVSLRGEHTTWAWTLFGLAWGIALLGVVFKLLWLGAPRWLSTGLYLLMGWMALAAIGPMARAVPPGGLLWLGLGGLFYSVGAVIYASKKPDFYPGVFGYHELWHLFVLAGSACHFMLMLLYVLPH